jgi:hypothetical protein
MSRSRLWLAALLLLPAPVHAQADKKPLLETWQAAYFEGLKVGHLHTIAHQTGTGESARITTARTMDLVIKRYGSVMPISIEQTSVETADGKVLALGLTQQLGKGKKDTYTGDVEGGNLMLKTSADDAVRKLPFDTNSLGLYAQEVIFRTKKVKPGDKLAATSYEILLGGTITIRATVKGMEKVDELLEKRAADGKTTITRAPVSLLRVDTVTDPVKVGGTEIKLPGKTVWLDGRLMPAREAFEMPGLGLITVYTTTKDAALKEGVAPERLPDFGLNINIPVKQDIDEPYKTTEAVYKVTTKEKLDKLFAEDDRQKVRDATDKGLELVVRARTEPGGDDKAAPPEKEYLESNVFVDSDDAAIKALAKSITGKETDPWRKALRIERWVHENMRVSSAVGFPSASQIAKDLEGDCRQHALLLAALCRAAGVPARTAIGLIYVRERGRSPYFGFHMWGEVWVRGRWVALDAVLGQGGIGATHLKMADHSWAKTATLAPLLPISQALGKLQIEVVKAK